VHTFRNAVTGEFNHGGEIHRTSFKRWQIFLPFKAAQRT